MKKYSLRVQNYYPSPIPGTKTTAWKLWKDKLLVFRKKEMSMHEALGFKYGIDALIIDTDDFFNSFAIACLEYHRDYTIHMVSGKDKALYTSMIEDLTYKSYVFTSEEEEFLASMPKELGWLPDATQGDINAYRKIFKNINKHNDEEQKRITVARHRFIDNMGGLWE